MGDSVDIRDLAGENPEPRHGRRPAGHARGTPGSNSLGANRRRIAPSDPVGGVRWTLVHRLDVTPPARRWAHVRARGHGPPETLPVQELAAVYQRRVDPIEQCSPVIGRKREKLEEEYAELNRRIDELDRELSRLSAERHALSQSRRALHRRLWLNLAKRGRRAAPDGRLSLPPLGHDATHLWGRRLRARCREILRRRGTLSLSELHAELHRCGYAVSSGHPVKALGDALGYDADQGRVQRVARGVYRLRA